jgi:hypothetical protein
MLLKPLDDVVGSTKDGRWPRRHCDSQSQRAVKRSETPTWTKPCATLCPLQVHQIVSLFSAYPIEVVVMATGGLLTAWRVASAIRLAPP